MGGIHREYREPDPANVAWRRAFVGSRTGNPAHVTQALTTMAPERPRRAPGVQLLGEYAGSGFKDPPALARRADGQVIQLPPLLYEVLARADGDHDDAAIAAEVSERVRRDVTADDIAFLVAEKLRPMGLLAAADGSAPPLPKANPFLALTFRSTVVPERVSAFVATMFAPLFHRVVWVPALLGFVAFDAWLFGRHGVAQPIRQSLVHPALILVLLGLVVASAAFHEAGHAAGCQYGGATPGRMGCGLYLAWPAFYTDVTDSYRLDRRGRLRTDLGGLYFNVLFVLGLAAAYALTRSEAVLLGAVVVHFEMAHQLIPVVRLDGYYIVSDLTGVPDLFGRIGPILRSALPWRPADPRVTVLKGWVRVAVAGWVLVLLPVLGAELVLILVHLPRIYGTGAATMRHLAAAADWSSFGLPTVTAALQIALLALPLVGIALMLGRAGRGLFRTTARATAGRPVARGLAAAVALVAIGVLAYSWLPPRNYRPIGPGEHGTLFDSVATGGRLLTGGSVVDDRPAGTTPTPQPTYAPSPTSVPSGPASLSPGATAPPSASATPSPTAASTSPTPTPTPTPTPSDTATPSPSPTP